MKNKFYLFALLLMLLISGCSASKDLNITFILNGGSLNENNDEKQTYRLNATGDAYTFNEILVPVKEGYLFEAWYSNKELTTYFDMLNTKITKHITLYAAFCEEYYDFQILEDNNIGVAFNDSAIELTNAILPKYLIGRKVTQLLANAFAKTKFTSINLTDSNIEVIKKNTFTNCKLENIVIGRIVTLIEEDAFYDGDSIKTVSILNNYKYFVNSGYIFEKLGNNKYSLLYAFAPSSTISDGIEISHLVFNITNIAAHAFKEIQVKNDTMVGYRFYLPATITTINDYAFEGFNVYRLNASNEKEYLQIMMYFPKTLVSVGKYAYANSTVNIVSLEKNSSLQIIDDYAFYNSKLSRFYSFIEYPNSYNSNTSALDFSLNIDGSSNIPSNTEITYNNTTLYLTNLDNISINYVKEANTIAVYYYIAPTILASKFTLNLTNNSGVIKIGSIRSDIYLSYLPKTINYIGDFAFANTNLKDLYFLGDYQFGDSPFINISGFRAFIPLNAKGLIDNFTLSGINFKTY